MNSLKGSIVGRFLSSKKRDEEQDSSRRSSAGSQHNPFSSFSGSVVPSPPTRTSSGKRENKSRFGSSSSLSTMMLFGRKQRQTSMKEKSGGCIFRRNDSLDYCEHSSTRMNKMGSKRLVCCHRYDDVTELGMIEADAQSPSSFYVAVSNEFKISGVVEEDDDSILNINEEVDGLLVGFPSTA